MIVEDEVTTRDVFDRCSGFNGWQNIAACENHAGFIKNHQQKIERIAVITDEWQDWLIGAVRIFVHPEVRAYTDEGHAREALQWIVE